MRIPSHTIHRVYDPLIRLTHAWNALAIIGLIVTSQLAEAFEHSDSETAIWQIHVLFGYALTGGLLMRLIWGFVGPATARWSDIWHPRAWASMLRGHLSFPPRLGHDIRASLAFVGVYAVLAVMLGTGLIMAATEFQMGPLAQWLGTSEAMGKLVKEPHEIGFTLVLAFIALHLVALLYHRFILHTPVDQAMITGKQYLPENHEQLKP
ncbi:MAG: cytochrome b/b6 domain-containing protein [Rugosibacter sp.]|jgi:Ni/Fe-hydrogenase 1 B-type cytochrome subunit|nr:cytochrome b/b6 domain-containing protein [Rugosibacter sp.]MDO9272121.1 cytochrome b/b6 domain-containing protein [Rugosibacter sp.]